MPNEKEYKEIYNKLIDYEQSIHKKNQERIRVGLKVNILLPLVFLVLSFAVSSAKLVFLIMWIISLFGIAGYLVYIEYSDYKLMNQMADIGIKKTQENSLIEMKSIIMENIQNMEKREVKKNEEHS